MPSVDYWQGRKLELGQIQQWLADASVAVVGVVGLGGFGKSTLAAKVLDESGASRRFWADVRTGTDFASLARRVLMVWGMAIEQVQAIPETNLTAILVKQLQSQSGLLVIDNLETLLTEAGNWQSLAYQQFLQAWIEFGAQSKILLTSRERPVLEARRSRWLPLEQGLSQTEGALLLRNLGILGEAAELESVADQVGGYPLSLMLVAGLLLAEEERDPQIRYLSNYGDLFQIRGLHRGDSHTSIADIFAWSVARLAAHHQQLLTQISVLRGAFNASAAAQVAGLEISEADLRQLVRRSLLQELPNRDKTDQRQFQLQPQVQTLVQRQAGDLTVAHQRAIDYYRSAAQPQPWRELEDVTEYLEIFHHCCELRRYADAFGTLWTGCDEFLDLRGHALLRTELYLPLVAQWQPTEAEQRGFAEMLNRLGNAYNSLGQYQNAIDLYQQWLEIARQIGNRRGEASSLGGLGNAYNSLGQYQNAIDFYQQSLEIARQIGDRRGEASSLGNLGNAYDSLGQYQNAIDFHQQQLEIARQIGDRRGEASSLGNLGNAYNSLGQYQNAIDFYQQQLEIARQIGDRRGEANSLGNLGNAYNSLGQYQNAIDFYQQQLEIARQIGDRRGEASSLGGLGIAYNSLGQYQNAIDFHQQQLEIARQIGDRRGEASSLGNLGVVLEKLGQPAAAQVNYQQARDLFAAMDVEQWRQWCEERLQGLEQGDPRSWMQRCAAWLWRSYQALWLGVRRWLAR